MTRILVVDDNQENRYLLEMLFKGHNYEVISSNNGAEALEKARQFPPDVIVTDILMPVMDGFTLCREWKTDPVLLHIPFIFYTATYTDPKDEDLALSLGAERFIIKPMDPEVLEQAVSEVLAQRSVRNSEEASEEVRQEPGFLKDYNEALFRKLQKKIADLEQLNQSMALVIAERKRAEEALHEQQMFSANLILNSATAAFVLDKTHKVMLWNKACEELTACQASVVIGTDDQWKPFFSNKRPTAADDIIDNDIEGLLKLRKGYSQSALNPRAVRSEGWYKKLGGKDRYIVFEAAPIFSSQGDLVAAIQTIQDITQSKRLEEQLLQSQKMEAIGLLAGGVAHDLNNFLGAMMGFTELLQMQIKEDNPARKYLDHFPVLTDRAATLIKNLMAFSRKQMLDIKPASLNHIVSTIGKLLSRVIGEDIKLNMKLSDEDIVINADAGQIEQAIMNLATNARDAMPQGGTLTISANALEIDDNFVSMHGYGKSGKYALLSVEDTGMGIDEDTREKIFEPFFTTKEVGKGTGLGLSMVYGIIKQHDGYINVYSEPGKGTTFRIYLPAIDLEALEVKPPDNIPRRGGTETILLVEDEASLRKATRSMLEKFGYNVIEAEDGEEAVNKFNEHKDEIKLVLMDVIMPHKSGKDAYRDMQNIQHDIKIIFTSGHTGDILTNKKIVEEGLHFITKPILPRELLDKMRDVLDKRND